MPQNIQCGMLKFNSANLDRNLCGMIAREHPRIANKSNPRKEAGGNAPLTNVSVPRAKIPDANLRSDGDRGSLAEGELRHEPVRRGILASAFGQPHARRWDEGAP